jgi:bacterioferritin-associated ferredoxin
MYVCICNAINEQGLREAAKRYCNIKEFFASNNIDYKCALCKIGLETYFMNLKEKERKDENNK